MYRLLVILFLFPLSLQAQTQDTLGYTMADTLLMDSVALIPEYDIFEDLGTPGTGNGEVVIVEGDSVNNLIKWHIHQNKRTKSFTGYRIQLYSVNSYGCDMEKLKEFRDEFETTFLDIPAYLQYFNPDFKIRAGNFHSRLESIPTLHRIREEYPASYPVKSEITLEELKRVPMQDILQDSTLMNLPDSTLIPVPHE